jgi:hypothetical protein
VNFKATLQIMENGCVSVAEYGKKFVTSSTLTLMTSNI